MAEPGNLRWDLWQDQQDETTFIIDEFYKEIDAVQAHRATPHFQNYASKINELATRTTSRPLDVWRARNICAAHHIDPKRLD